MRGIKLLDIGYINVLYVVMALVFAKLTDYIMGQFNSNDELKKSKSRLTLEFILALWIYGISIYVARNLVGLIPFPLDGYQGFEHRRVKELGSATAFTFTYVLFSDYIKNKLLFYYNTFLK
jgi:hypothetical protein